MGISEGDPPFIVDRPIEPGPSPRERGAGAAAAVEKSWMPAPGKAWGDRLAELYVAGLSAKPWSATDLTQEVLRGAPVHQCYFADEAWFKSPTNDPTSFVFGWDVARSGEVTSFRVKRADGTEFKTDLPSRYTVEERVMIENELDQLPADEVKAIQDRVHRQMIDMIETEYASMLRRCGLPPAPWGR